MSQNTFTKQEVTASAPVEFNCRLAEEVEVQIISLSGGDSLAVARSLDGENYVDYPMLDTELETQTSFTAAGIYTVAGGAWLRFTKTGSASSGTTVYLRLIIPG